MPLSYQKFQIWLLIEAGLILSIITTNSRFFSVRALFPQQNSLNMGAIPNTHSEETDYIEVQQILIGYVNILSVPLLL
jgi:hypothetical protein